VTMAITHVVRGEDHISNTPKQILIYQALGAPLPIFAHVPLILGPDKKRLSKRHGATSVGEYEAQGYLPEAMVNFLALLGWSPGNDQELFTRDELVAVFGLDGVSGGNAVFNLEKLDWFNQQHILRMPAAAILAKLSEVFESAGLKIAPIGSAERARIEQVIELVKPRARKLEDFVALTRPFWATVVDRDSGALQKHLSDRTLLPHLVAWRECVEQAPTFDATTLEGRLRTLAAERGVKPGPLIHATRVAVTGQAVSPGLFEVLALMGRDRVISRLLEAERLLQ
jgi:glutamyl/glutaminyl-tRNA synthetase